MSILSKCITQDKLGYAAEQSQTLSSLKQKYLFWAHVIHIYHGSARGSSPYAFLLFSFWTFWIVATLQLLTKSHMPFLILRGLKCNLTIAWKEREGNLWSALITTQGWGTWLKSHHSSERRYNKKVPHQSSETEWDIILSVEYG